MTIRRSLAGATAAALIACAAALASAGSARADPRAPWCVDTADLGAGLQCNYFSFEECQIAARGVSNICTVNPYYVPEAVPVRRQYSKRRRDR
jgi:hypothetical protein